MVLWCYNVEGDFMAYFLKQSNLKKGLYLQIYESFYNPEKNQTSHRSVKALGYVNDLISEDIPDPVAFYKAEVSKMNDERKKEKTRLISSSSAIRHIGYFPFKAILENLNISRYIDFFHLTNDFDFKLSDVLSSLIYARAVNPCSKHRTFHEVMPCLYESYDFSYDQLLEGLGFLGNEYEKIVELFTSQVRDKYGLNTSQTYFDCTNFYFEIDREDDFRRKGPSKENRRDPIVGLGLLLDANQIPIGMKMYPGNESEKPVLRDVINGLKQRHNIEGHTVQVADKGLNCAENIYNARQNGDGYLFSKSVKQLPETEKTWVLLEHGYHDVRDKDGTLKYRWKECVDKFPYTYTDSNGKRHTLNLTEKRVVTFNPSLAKKKKIEIERMVEKAITLSSSMAKRNEYGETSRYVLFKSTSKGKKTEDKVKTELNQEQIQKDLELAGYNLLVTSEIKMSAQDIYDTYHNLWRIEESFRIMKTDLDARPVYLQKEENIKGHFLICYLTVLLGRILQFKILKNKYSSSEVFGFIRNFNVAEAEGKYINLATSTSFIKDFAKLTDLPLEHYLLTQKKLNKVLNFRF